MTQPVRRLQQPARDWRTRAVCLDVPGDVFFPDTNRTGIEIARSYCETCPVKRACLFDAIRDEGGTVVDSRWGIRGGLTPRERHNLYRQLQRRGLV